MSFLLLSAKERIAKNNNLIKLEKLLNWSRIQKILTPLYKKGKDLGGQRAYNPLQMFKAVYTAIR